jgi:L-aminopeptidase/D-esterase-like protein
MGFMLPGVTALDPKRKSIAAIVGDPLTERFTVHQGCVEQPNRLQSYGATVFLFAEPIRCVCEVLGGAAGTYFGDERDVFYEDPNKCNRVDALFFAGGANAGLVVGAGVAEHLAQKQKDLKLAPGLPVVKGAITAAGSWNSDNPGWVYPTAAFGRGVCESRALTHVKCRQFGAGVEARVGSIDSHRGDGFHERLAGQGWFAASSTYDKGCTCYAYVTLNAKGRIVDYENEQRSLLYVDEQGNGPSKSTAAAVRSAHAARSTNIMVITNAKFPSIEHMKQVARQVLASLARVIVPFACPSDGDVLFFCSTEEYEVATGRLPNIGLFLSETLHQAVFSVFPR